MPDSHMKMTVILVATFNLAVEISDFGLTWGVQKGKRLFLTHKKLCRVVHKD